MDDRAADDFRRGWDDYRAGRPIRPGETEDYRDGRREAMLHKMGEPN